MTTNSNFIDFTPDTEFSGSSFDTFFEDVCEDYTPAPKKRGRKKKMEDIVTEERGEYLMRVLGLTNVKKTPKPVVKKVEVVEDVYETAAKKVYDFRAKDFSIKFNNEYGWIITHKSWNDVYITNEDYYIVTEVDAKKFILAYIKDTKRPLNKRGISFKFHLVPED